MHIHYSRLLLPLYVFLWEKLKIFTVWYLVSLWSPWLFACRLCLWGGHGYWPIICSPHETSTAAKTFFSPSSSFWPCPQLKLSTRLPIAILNKSYWLHSCLMMCMRLVQYNCIAGSTHRTGDSRPVYCALSENPSTNGKPLPALSYLFSIPVWHSIYHSLIQRKTSTSKAPHPFTESSPSEPNEHIEIQWILICCYIRTRDKSGGFIRREIEKKGATLLDFLHILNEKNKKEGRKKKQLTLKL